MGYIYRPSYTVRVRDPATGEERREKRQSRTWWIRWYRSGKRNEESSDSSRKSDAVQLLKLREGAVARGEPVSAEAGRVTVDAALADVVADYTTNAKRTTAQVQRRIRLHLLPFFGGRRLASITTVDVRAYTVQRLESGAANATINRELAILKRAFRLAEQAGTVLHRPHVPMLAEDNTRTGFFERDEFDAVRAALPDHLRGVVTFAYLTGWRVPSEVLTLQWKQVDRKAKTVRLEPGTTKNGEARTFPYGALPELADVIETAWAEHQRLAEGGTLCPYVFHRRGRPIRDCRDSWLRACEAAGIPGALMHDFRRTAVRNLVRAGVPDTVAMKLTGHKTRSVFDRYNVTSGADLEEAVGRLAGAAGQERGKIASRGRVRRFPEKI
jgi:integrase